MCRSAGIHGFMMQRRSQRRLVLIQNGKIEDNSAVGSCASTHIRRSVPVFKLSLSVKVGRNDVYDARPVSDTAEKGC